VSDDLTLLPEAEARHALRHRNLRFSLLAPYGSWLGRGTLRVLRLKTDGDETTELVAGYESYERLDAK
jgi:hypothetical protein